MFLFLCIKNYQALLAPWCWSSVFFVISGFDPEFMNNYAAHTHKSLASVATADETE